MLQLWLVANTILWTIRVKLGGITLNLSTVVLVLAGIFWFGTRRKIDISSAKVVLGVLVYLAFSFVAAVTGPCQDGFQKSTLTVPILCFLMLTGLEIGRRSDVGAWIALERTAPWCLLIAFLGFIVEMLMPSWFAFQVIYRVEGKFSGLFQEPSHVAFSLFPCIAILLVSESKTSRRNGIVALVVLLAFSRSSTLIALTAFFVIYRLFVRGKIGQTAIITLSAACVILLAATIDYSHLIMPTVVKVTGIASPDETENLSSLVYVLGWQDAWFNLRRTHGMGLGLNMMGCSPLPDVTTRAVLALQGFGELNATDGSFLFSKVVSEAGVLGIAFYGVLIWWWLRLGSQLRILGKTAVRRAVTAQAALIFCFIASSFIRDAGYFDGGLLLWLAAASGASAWRRDASRQLAVAHANTPLMGPIPYEDGPEGDVSQSSATQEEDN